MRLNISRNDDIRMDQTPKSLRWSIIPLYKILSTGDMGFWQILYDGMNKLHIREGSEDNPNTSEIYVQCNENYEARKKYIIKYKEGYRPAGSTSPHLLKGMKGYEYKEKGIRNWPVYTQPKLNGIRMLCQDIGGIGLSSISMRSLLNTSYNHLSHIENDLRDFFPYLPRYCTLDGELYNHSMDFGDLISAVKTVKSIHPKLNEIQYWIFDINYDDSDGSPFEKRYELLVNAYSRYIEDRSKEGITVLPLNFIIVPTQIGLTHSKIMEQNIEFISMGYEGIMIKKISNGASPGSKDYLDSLYKEGKCNNILKYKKYKDEEAIIISYTEDLTNTLFIVKDTKGDIFPVSLVSNFYNKYSFFEKVDLIGKELTIRYQQLLPLTCPIGIAIRDYE